MGVATRRPILPAPTDSSIVESAEETSPGTELDLATDLSRLTDRTSHTIPADGSPITITTAPPRAIIGKLAKIRQQSQTSLLIEYYEGGKGSDSARQPSLRVKVTPSSRKNRDLEDGHIVVTEAHGTRKPSYRRKISLGTDSPGRVLTEENVSSLHSGTDRLVGSPPLEIEVLPRDGSEFSNVSNDARYIIPPSDISSMPPESVLEIPTTFAAPAASQRVKTNTMGEESVSVSVSSQPSGERFQQKVIEKLSNKPRVTSGGRRRHGEKSRSRVVSEEIGQVAATEGLRKASQRREDESGNTSSVVTNSLLSAGRKSTDQVSFRSGSGVSQTSSLNNPRLLQTVEDAIRRLILPELKELKKDQKMVSKSAKYDRDPSDISGSSISREEYVQQQYEESGKPVLSSGSKHRHRRRKDLDLDSPSERSSRRRVSVDSVSVEDDHGSRRRKDHHRVRDATAAALATGGLTAAALKHHDSRSSVEREEREERRERRKKTSRSRSSRSASIAESEEIFHKHYVPPMPMRSEIDSELTRSSLLSEQTASTTTPLQREVREVIRGSSREYASPSNRTPTRTPADLRRVLGTHHGNLSERDLSTHQEEIEEDIHDDRSPHYGGRGFEDAAVTGIGLLAADHLLEDPERTRKYESNLHQQHPIRRGLSPIQSVASYQTTEPNRNSMMQPRSTDSLVSLKKRHEVREEMSIDSLSSAPSTDLARSTRLRGLNIDKGGDIVTQHDGIASNHTRDLDADEFYDEQHSQNDRYRESFASGDPKGDARRMTSYTEDSLESPYLDKVTAGKHVAKIYGANPEYVHIPPGVESAVASLYDPSVLDPRGPRSSIHSYTDSMSRREYDSPRSLHQETKGASGGSPLKGEYFGYSQDNISHARKPSSPVQSEAHSMEDREVTRLETNQPPANTFRQNAGGKAAISPDSDITTNPPSIQGPIGGLVHGTRDPWLYGGTPPRSKDEVHYSGNRSRDISTSGTNLVPDALGVGLQSGQKRDAYLDQPIGSTTPGANDEGYMTGENPKPTRFYSPALRSRTLESLIPLSQQYDALGGEDPFTTRQAGYQDNYPMGPDTPFFDATTGRGIDGIKSKDIVALMDHLTVRDAQRNARDTEILVTLVRSAAEMRNSLAEMKNFIAEQGDLIIDTTGKQHEKTQKAIGGPRPLMTGSGKFTRSIRSEEEDIPTKRRNVFRRALQGLSSKNTNELQHMEAMLMQLLTDVEFLRAAEEGRQDNPQENSLHSNENVRAPTDPGYEPEGQAGTSSTGGRSGYPSNNSLRQAEYRNSGGRRESGNRVSTVMEGDEDYDGQGAIENQITTAAPTQPPPRSIMRETYNGQGVSRDTSQPVLTPTRLQQQQPASGHVSIENTPQMSTEGSSSRKHKSTGSSFFPRISRWSKTTASSVADNFRSSGQTAPKPRPYSQESHSGSHLDEFAYDPHGDDRIRSQNSLVGDHDLDQENRPPSPLIPSQVSEKPKYQAHRNSLNLQHPQPRQGPTGRFQHHLENEAQSYDPDRLSPASQTSSQWDNAQGGGDVNVHHHDQRPYVPQGHLSPISDDYSETSSAMKHQEQGRADSFQSSQSGDSTSRRGPPPPPKIRHEEPLVPQRPPKVAMTPPAIGNRQATYLEHVAAARAGSPALDKSPISALRSSPAGHVRKPSGPRPITNSGSAPASASLNKPQTQGRQLTIGGVGPGGDGGATPPPIKKTRFRGSPNQLDDSSEEEQY